MKLHRLLASALCLLADAALAQPSPELAPPPLPLRNVLIEVRQDSDSSSSREQLQADARARVQAGQSSAEIVLDARSSSTDRRSAAQQQVLVLNGRSAAIALGNAAPLRLRQLVTTNGLRRLAPGVVWLDAGTGFTATPIWEGGDMIYLGLSATQSRQVMGSAAGAQTTLVLPLDVWTTVAESDETLDQQLGAQGLASAGRDSRTGSRALRIQVRLSVR